MGRAVTHNNLGAFMISSIRKWLGICSHKWETKETGTLWLRGAQIGNYVDLRCEHCGEWKRKNLTAYDRH